METIADPAALRQIYPTPKERSLRKEVDHLDAHCRHFIALSPLCVMSTASPDGEPDLSPRGGAPGFVLAPDSHTLVLPDRPGNNRLDSLSKLAANPRLALLFLVPGIDETLRVFGTARITPGGAAASAETDRHPDPTVLHIDVTRAYFHCAKALMRAHLWDDDSRVDRATFPTLGKIINDQIGVKDLPEAQDDMVQRYRQEL